MKIQIFSDLHLEFPENRFKFVDVNADVIVLAGDIANYKNSLPLIQKLFPEEKDIIYVAGNHEFYGTSFDEGYSFLENESKKYANIHFLENDVFEKEDTVFLGATLWTDFNLFNNYHSIKDLIKSRIRDFSVIKTPDGERITTETIRQRFYSSLQFFKETIKKHKGKKIVVITHHLPTIKALPPESLTSNTMLGFDPTPAAFASNLEYFIEENSEIALWIHGHSHYNYHKQEIRIGKTKLTCNQLGYYFEKTGFLNDYCITV